MMNLLGIGLAGVVAVAVWTAFVVLLVLPLPVAAWVTHRRDIRRAAAVPAVATLAAARPAEIVAAA